jgi:hypothetical protein
MACNNDVLKLQNSMFELCWNAGIGMLIQKTKTYLSHTNTMQTFIKFGQYDKKSKQVCIVHKWMFTNHFQI